jgi:hypothetical protein
MGKGNWKRVNEVNEGTNLTFRPLKPQPSNQGSFFNEGKIRFRLLRLLSAENRPNQYSYNRNTRGCKKGTPKGAFFIKTARN